MKTFRPGDIVLLSFPYADATGAKRRPSLIVLDTGDEDVVVARVTTQPAKTEFDVAVVEWQQAGLLAASVVRLHKLATLQKRLVERRLGALTANDWDQVRASIQRLWASL
ncbi:MAG: type II toxin-antitoxin system PemK/MazF family toxin [Planctomycetes bacterium]|nr:type II toxin-antitoxin system PemK/MazF family toxin [Planctomycetota bacterium]